MASDLNIELKKILLKRRNKVIVNTNNNIFDIFKDNIEKRISELKTFKDHCTIESINGFTVVIKINDKFLNFSNGDL